MTTMNLTSSLDRLLAVLPVPLQAEAARRFAVHAPVLRERLLDVYGADAGAGFDAWFGDLLAAIGQLLAVRPAALLAQDARRLAAPDWFTSEHMLGYSAYVPQFGGTLRGVAGRIDHLRKMGVTYLHLLPFLRARVGENDGGFAVASFDDVEPALGSNADLDWLCAQLREAGISLCADLVLNHVADDHPWARGAACGDARLRSYFHVFAEQGEAERHERTLGQVFPEAAPGNFTYVEAMGGWVWTTFYPFQWDLNYANPDVFSEMACALLRLANRGVDVFRLDSTAFLWKREGTASMNQPEAHALLQALRAIVGIAAPGVLLKAEAIVPTAELPAYFGQADAPECHLAYHSTLMAASWAALAEQDASLLRAVVAATPPLPAAASWLSYVRCHDDIGWKILAAEAGTAQRLTALAQFYGGQAGSFAAGVAFQSAPDRPAFASNGMAASLAGLETAVSMDERDNALRRLLLVYGVALSFGALPVLYMGDELGMQNDYSYKNDPERAHDTRWVQRPIFDEAGLQQRDQGASVTGSLFARLSALIAARRRLPALAGSAARHLYPSCEPSLVALGRGAGFLNLSNFSSRCICVSLSALGAGSWPGQADLVELGPWDMLWLEREVAP